uniref:Uncharacterized protein n=1 Tax=Cajanus cajan TaxID=3821 RepID=A0A151R6S5_CAJCA|nr:hypothetical protein KK1_040574 [Cajanus cajan]
MTFVNGVEQVFDATSMPAQSIRSLILEKDQYLKTEQMFCEVGESWPVIIPDQELSQTALPTKVRFQFILLILLHIHKLTNTFSLLFHSFLFCAKFFNFCDIWLIAITVLLSS